MGYIFLVLLVWLLYTLWSQVNMYGLESTILSIKQFIKGLTNGRSST